VEPACWCQGELVGPHDHIPDVLVINCPISFRVSSTQKETTTSTCPDCTSNPDGSIGINPISMETMRFTLKNNLTLSPEAINFITYSNNNTEVIAVYNYLDANGFDGVYAPEAIAFAENAIEAFTKNSLQGTNHEVDFPNRVILDETFVNNIKLKCVYDKLTSDNNSLFRDTVGAFIDDPDFNLTFKVGVCENSDD